MIVPTIHVWRKIIVLPLLKNVYIFIKTFIVEVPVKTHQFKIMNF